MEANLQIIGLIFDAAGIVVLVAPALIGMVGQIAAQSGTYWGYNKRAIPILSSSHVDTAVGAPLLLLGFLMQIAGLFGFGVSLAVSVGLCVLLALVLALYWMCLRTKLLDKLSDRVKGRLDAEDKKEDEET